MENLHNNPVNNEPKTPAPLRKTSIDFRATKILSALVLLLLSMSMSSCAVVGGIFKAGMGVGIFLVVLVIVVVIVLIVRSGKK
ncbi:hypothetical protein BH11BAC7_BH11BAC7_15630 [soil metagenome]